MRERAVHLCVCAGRSFLGVLVLLAVRVDLLAPRPFVVLGLVSLTLCPWACAVGRTFRCLGAMLAQGHLCLYRWLDIQNRLSPSTSLVHVARYKGWSRFSLGLSSKMSQDVLVDGDHKMFPGQSGKRGRCFGGSDIDFNDVSGKPSSECKETVTTRACSTARESSPAVGHDRSLVVDDIEQGELERSPDRSDKAFYTK